MIRIKRAYDPPDPGDGQGFLGDRLWPRGVRKDALALDAWLKDVAPSNGLRRWFGHDPAKWEAFQQRYFAELDEKPQAWQPLLEAADQGDITLVYGARDPQYNNAVALKAYLEHKLTPQETSNGL